jgi:hypothetical protein
MTSAYFHDGELNTFINETTGLNANDLLERYREDITANKITRATNGLRRKLRDYLDSKGVPCGKGTGDPIQGRLLDVLRLQLGQFQLTGTSNPASGPPSMASAAFGSQPNLAKRDFLKLYRTPNDQYCGPHEGSILRTIRGIHNLRSEA